MKLILDLFDVVLDYRHGIRLATSVDAKILITLNARSENDRTKFVEDLKEAILEVGELLHLLLFSFLCLRPMHCDLETLQFLSVHACVHLWVRKLINTFYLENY